MVFRVVRCGVVSLKRVMVNARTLTLRRWLSRVPMMVDSEQSQVSCICAVNGTAASFQIDCGSTFTQIIPSLAPARVPRYGLGFAKCLDRLLWFPTCQVNLAPVDSEGYVVQERLASSDHEVIPTLVQIGAVNLLGLQELRRWRVQLSFSPLVHCSVAPEGNVPELDRCGASPDGPTVLLESALQAAAALSEGKVAVEEGQSEQYPWRVDINRVMMALGVKQQGKMCWMRAASLQPVEDMSKNIVRQLVPVQPPVVPSVPDMGVLFGTADALISQTIPLPLLAPPALPL